MTVVSGYSQEWLFDESFVKLHRDFANMGMEKLITNVIMLIIAIVLIIVVAVFWLKNRKREKTSIWNADTEKNGKNSDNKNNNFRLFTRCFNLMFHPAREWKEIEAENNNRKVVYIRFVVPLLCLMTIAIIICTWLYTPSVLYTTGYVVHRITFLWVSLSTALYISTFAITEIMAQQLGSKNYDRIFTLIAYSLSAVYLAYIINDLFPLFGGLIFIVLGLYSCYLYWLGNSHLIHIKGKKQTIYGLSTLIITVLIHLEIFFYFGKVFEVIFF